ncbi:MAG: HAMP domain-containing protein [Alphaproteobacteria bacterium]|nr:HAMP domain-containing protein [Alphaproteobacteria bacterium]
MRLKTLFLAGMGFSCLLAILGALAIVVQEWRQADAINQAAAAVEALQASLTVSERLALERGGYNEALLNDNPASDATFGSLGKLRVHTDQALDRTLASVAQSQYDGAGKHYGQLLRLRDRLNELRARALTEIQRPKAARDLRFATSYAEQMFAITAKVTDVQAGIELAADRANPQIGQFAGISRVVGLVRDYAGRRQTLYVQILSGGRAVDTQMERTLADGDARIDVYWARVITMISLTDEPRLNAAAAAVHREYFDANAAVYARIREANPPSNGWSGDVASFRSWGVPTLQSILKLRDAAFAIAEEHISQARHAAIINLGFALIAAALVTITAAACALHFGRRFVYPLSRIEGTLALIAEGQLDIAVPETHHRNEIGQVARALDTLRRKLIAAGQERDERENQLRGAKVAAEAASRAKSEFLAGMSHELRTPLNAVIGFSELMLMEPFGALPGPYRGYVEDIITSGKHLLGLINDLLDFTKIEAGRLQLVDRAFDLTEAIKSCVHMLEPRARKQGVQLTHVIDPDFIIRGDEQRVNQVLLNLLSNAVKFTPEGGRVWVKGGRNARGDIEISVSDTGIGIAEADMERVMEVFGQAETGMLHSKEGTGLGLPLTKRLVDAMGGEFALASQVNVGTVATVTLPADRMEPPQSPPDRETQLQRSAA